MAQDEEHVTHFLPNPQFAGKGDAHTADVLVISVGFDFFLFF